MPIATEIKMKGSGSNKNFPNNFLKLELAAQDINLVNGENYFKLDADIAGFELVYLYIVFDVDVDVDLEVFRSVGIDSKDTKFAVPIPGGSSSLLAAGTAADFSISLFGGDNLWLKVEAPAFNPGKNKITDMFLMIKR